MDAPQLLKMDELVMGDHYYILPDDDCYYFMEYTARAGYSHSEANQLIHNFKKSVAHKGKYEYKYKGIAINKVATLFRDSLESVVDFETAVVVPIPPSKIKTNPLFDDRMMQVLRKYCGTSGDVREMLVCRQDMDAAHMSEERPSVEDLEANMYIDPGACDDLKDTIVLFDDVITTGAHFRACKNIIADGFPEKNVIGVFIARRSIPAGRLFDFDGLFE